MKLLKEYKIFVKHFNTLKELSIDNSDVENIIYMNNSLLQALNFDDVKEEYSKNFNISQMPSSCDAILQLPNDKIAFIEFKNGKIEQENIRSKIKDSLLIFCDIIEGTIKDTRDKAELILVYNLEKNPQKYKKFNSYDKIVNYVGNLAEEEIVRFHLKQFQNLYFNKVHTYSQEEFEQYLQKNFKNML